MIGIANVSSANFTISKSQNRGNVTINQINRSALGGIAGYLSASNAANIIVRDSYTTGTVLMNGTGNDSAGGLVGGTGVDATSSMAFINVHSSSSVSSSTGTGALLGTGSATFTSAYYSLTVAGATQATGTGAIAGATGLSDSAMLLANSYVGWDFASVWQLTSNQPTLR